MIIINSRGQLGNQLFQYSFAFSLSKRFNTFFLIDKIDTRDSLHYFTLKHKQYSLYVISRFFYNIKLHMPSRLYNILLKILYTIAIKKEYTVDDWKDPEEQLAVLQDQTYYRGYFQSLTYFKAYESIIRQLFTVKQKYRQVFENQYGKLFNYNRTLVIHIRRGDFLTAGTEALAGKDLSLPITYYEKALQTVSDITLYQMIFISDDITFVKEHFGQYANAHFSNNGEIIDFQMIMNADVAIIANSTFGWWAALLNGKAHKKIISPDHWLGFRIKKEFPVGIIPESWHQINIYD